MGHLKPITAENVKESSAKAVGGRCSFASGQEVALEIVTYEAGCFRKK